MSAGNGNGRPDAFRAFVGLIDARRWVAWRQEIRGRKPTKVPYSPVTGRLAKSNDPSTWGTLEQALTYAEQERMDGPGINLGDGLGGVDLDACRNPKTGEILPWARKIIDDFDSYTEVSPSGTGVKIWAWGVPNLPAHEIPMEGEPIRGKKPAVECFDRGRYFAVTGDILDGSTDEIRDCGEVGGAWDRLVRLLLERGGAPSGNGDTPPKGAGLPDDVRDLLAAVSPDCAHDQWLRVGMALHHADSVAGLALWDEWSAAAPARYPGSEETRRRWTSFQADRAGGVTIGTLRHMARADGGGLGTERTILDPRDPLDIARRILATHYTLEGGRRTLHAWRGELRRWTGSHYSVIEDAGARAGIYGYLESAFRPGKPRAEPFRPTAAAVNNVLDALRAAAYLDGTTTAPAWLDGRLEPDPRELIALNNGLLNVRTRELLPHSPDLLCTHVLPYNYDPAAAEPTEWLRFLRTLWLNDPGAADTLQEIVAYLLSGETRLQKMFLLVGPKRSGKGTIARVLRALLGPENVAGPTLSSFATNFGLQSLIDRPLAIVSDARLSGRADQAVIVERLLSISGEDVLTVDRKHRDPWIGQLPTRILILSNELPRLADTSGAMASRFIVLTLSESFYGREDTTLSDRLIGELPGILRWALDGLDRLRKRGFILQPASSAEAIEELEDLASPVGAFLRECCEVGPGCEVGMDTLYARWRRWCEERGREHPGTEQSFGRDLRAAVPAIGRAQRGTGSQRTRVYLGIRLRGL